MVSLGSARGQFFDHEGNEKETEPLLENSAVINTEDTTEVFRPIPLAWAIVSQITLLVIFEVLSFVLPNYCCANGPVRPQSVLVYSHVTLWLLLLLLDYYLHQQHRKYRRKGYLEFYQRTRYLRRSTPLIIATGNGLLLAVVMLVEEFESGIKPYNYVQIIGSLEVAVALPLLLLYLVKAIKFNQQQASPDVEREDLTASYTHGQVPCTDIGFRDTDKLEEVLEKQADLIRYLKQHNASLGKKIVKLTAELKSSSET